MFGRVTGLRERAIAQLGQSSLGQPLGGTRPAYRAWVLLLAIAGPARVWWESAVVWASA